MWGPVRGATQESEEEEFTSDETQDSTGTNPKGRIF